MKNKYIKKCHKNQNQPNQTTRTKTQRRTSISMKKNKEQIINKNKIFICVEMKTNKILNTKKRKKTKKINKSNKRLAILLNWVYKPRRQEGKVGAKTVMMMVRLRIVLQKLCRKSANVRILY